MDWRPTAWVEGQAASDLVCCGVDRDGQHVTVRIGPCPVHGYLLVPEPWLDAADLARLVGEVRWAAENALRNRSHHADQRKVECAALEARSIYGYAAAPSQFIRFAAATAYALKDVVKALADWGVVRAAWVGRPVCTFETGVTALTRFLHAHACAPHSPLRVVDDDDDVRRGRTRVPPSAVSLAPAHWATRYMTVASFDIEVMSADGHSFPSAARDGDFVAQIGVLLRRPEGESALVFVCQPTADIPGVEVRRSATEHGMLVEFVRWLYASDVDCLVGYNIFGFDWAYILDRVERTTTSYVADVPKWRAPRRVKRSLQSAAFGCNEHVYLHVPGVVQVDLLVYLRREMKLESYKLDDVAYALTKERKIDLPPKQIFAKLASGDAAQRAEVAVYCIQDCRLVADIVESRDVLIGLFETADVTGVQCSDILSRGMQIRSFTQILREATPLGFLLPDTRRDADAVADEHYEGATVLHAQPGIYYDAVAGLDFASLYPSIMISDNICYATLLDDDPRTASVPHYAIADDGGTVLARFASDVVGVLPTLLRKLWAGRKETKALMASESDPMRRKLLNAKQLAQKVGMNSVYGLTGATRGMLPCVRIAAAITAQGRAMLKQSKEYVETHFPCEVVYGDSVAADTLLTVLEGDTRRTLRVDALYAELDAMRHDGPRELCILTHAGVQPVLAAVRHETTKRMFRVTLASGASVDVTEDHSLISGAGDAVCPTDLVVGTTRIMVVAAFEKKGATGGEKA